MCLSTAASADKLFFVGLGDLTNKLGPAHVHGAVNLTGLRSPIVLEDFHHQSRVVGKNDARLQHAQKPGLPLGLAERARGIDGHICVETFAHGGDGRESGADFERDAGKNQLLAARGLDGCGRCARCRTR
jgi:hypothetical protein